MIRQAGLAGAGALKRGEMADMRQHEPTFRIDLSHTDGSDGTEQDMCRARV